MFLRLLVARATIWSILSGGEDDEVLDQRRAVLKRQAADEAAPPELRRSLGGQIEIIEQRIEQRRQAENKLTYIDAELARIEEQVELIREQAAMSTDPELLSQRIDEITATLGGTGQWIRDQQKVYGAMEDLLSEPPPLTPDARARESQ
jgi:RNA binding exosome subunit